MERVMGALVAVSLIALALSLMIASWRRRVRRDSAVRPLHATVAAVKPPVFVLRCLYVATTPRDSPWERVAVAGLAFRAWATVSVEANGVRLTPEGEESSFFPRERLVDVSDADSTIDRSAGPGSLTVIHWRDDRGTVFSSFFRVPSRKMRAELRRSLAELVDSAQNTIAHSPTDAAEPTSDTHTERSDA